MRLCCFCQNISQLLGKGICSQTKSCFILATQVLGIFVPCQNTTWIFSLRWSHPWRWRFRFKAVLGIVGHIIPWTQVGVDKKTRKTIYLCWRIPPNIKHEELDKCEKCPLSGSENIGFMGSPQEFHIQQHAQSSQMLASWSVKNSRLQTENSQHKCKTFKSTQEKQIISRIFVTKDVFLWGPNVYWLQSWIQPK